ncbi:MAG: Hsp20/alpha crystallin family protein [Gammaproteobacteria bacterium]|nr:Hsp20/alpha crystallin family protein [Gammaproteobacteria bacterium]
MDPFARTHSMWTEACALLEEAERRHRQFFQLLAAPSARPVWEPPVDVFSDAGEWLITVALPGARAEEVVVRLRGSDLLIAALVPPPRLGPHSRVTRVELPYGRMRRRIELPPGRYAVAERGLERGCLFLRILEVTV